MTPGLVSFGTKGTVHVAIVEKPEEQAKGLSGKMSLPPDEGMLFWFGTRGDWAFVMKNTLIPLDILFLDFGQVVGIITLQPNDLVPHRIGRLSSSVLETNAGWSARHGVVVGDRVSISLV